MELTEKERESLEKERDKIKELSMEILELENDPNNSVKLKQNVIGIQFSINRLSSYSRINQNKLDACAKIASAVLGLLSSKPPEEVIKGLESEIIDPSDELLKKAKIKRDQWVLPHQNVAYPLWWSYVVDALDIYCNFVNSIRFDFTKKGLKINFPKITLPKNLFVGNIFNKLQQ